MHPKIVYLFPCTVFIQYLLLNFWSPKFIFARSKKHQLSWSLSERQFGHGWSYRKKTTYEWRIWYVNIFWKKFECFFVKKSQISKNNFQTCIIWSYAKADNTQRSWHFNFIKTSVAMMYWSLLFTVFISSVSVSSLF